MPPKIFATGTTGYVGGDVLHSLLQLHPTWESSITCLTRSPTRAVSLASTYPSIKIVHGTLDDSSILEEEVSKADIVLHWASCDHVGAAEAIKRGLERGGKKACWIHTSGTDILLNPEIWSDEGKYIPKYVKEGDSKVYDDWEGIKELFEFPETHSHRPCDKVVLSLATSPNIKTAVICPPTIWGVGRGSGSQRSMQIYELARLVLETQSKIRINPPSGPKTFWPNIHIHDLTKLYLEIIYSAATELEGNKSKATWGLTGYYFAENGIHYWQDVVDNIITEAVKQGYLKSADLPEKEVDDEVLKSAGPAILNTEASCRYVRAKELFGWVPGVKELKAEIEAIVDSEARRAGISKRV